ncbi:MAG: hypothetical protein AVDCRST_MAG79-2004 [uncultured Thermoleophilia bacterium]|uniref:Uncharacterized protein n=1 Tax=uncultured Thermoleophilia bacterium TaxID=1497501 RepID=A0A6J4U9V0_9ACTN|nr:MAG: hypothetical protein AVDCRST_MAG79-2004 [uncultured Thermoleophilia bacterium]
MRLHREYGSRLLLHRLAEADRSSRDADGPWSRDLPESGQAVSAPLEGDPSPERRAA